MSEFEQRLHVWQQLMNEKKLDEAEEYYWTNIFDEVVKIVSSKGEHFQKQVKYLISLVGMSPEPVILTIKTLKPDEVLFLYTKDSRNVLDPIIERTGLKISQFLHRNIESSRTEDVYIQIRDYLKDKSAHEVAIDISGGKKSMVGGAAQAAAILGCQIFYVDTNDFRKEWRRPFPGSETLVFLENPYHIFGELEIRESLKLYDEGNYPGALQILERLKDRVPDIQKINILYSIIQFHKLWEEYQFAAALEMAQSALSYINQFRQFKELTEPIQEKVYLFEKLVNSDHIEYLVINHYFISQKYFQRGRYDFAVMLLYRTLELLFALHLKRKYNIDTSQAEYPDPEEMLIKFNTLAKEIFKNTYTEAKELPKKLGLMNSAFVLKILNDELLKKIKLSDLRYQADKRNSGILAHGITPNTSNDYKSMNAVFKPIIDRFVNLYFNNLSVDDFATLFHPIKINVQQFD